MAKASKFQLPPNKQATLAARPGDKKLKDFIGQGGQVKTEAPESTEPEAFKNFNIKILESQWEAINKLREKRPKPVGQKSPGISLHNWILEAIAEKLGRD